jgi:hypothetical protein
MDQTTPIPNYSDILSILHAEEPATIITTAAKEETHPEDTTLAKSEQERIRDLAQYLLTLPIPYITPIQLQDATRSWADQFSITALTGILSAFAPGIGLMEGAIITTAVQEWAKAELDNAELLQETLAQDIKNPLSLILEKYISAHPSGILGDIDLKQTLTNLPILTALLHLVPADLLTKAYLISEQQIINTMLSRWVESEIKRAAESREDAQRNSLVKAQLRAEFIALLIEKSKTSEIPSVLVSIVIFGSLFGSSTIGIKTFSESIIKEICGSLHLPAAIVDEFAYLTQGIMLSALTWAAASAISLLQLEGNSPSEKTQSIIAAKAYCLSLLRMMEDPSVTSFLQSRLIQAVKTGIMTPAEAVQTYASIRCVLLINAAISLYKAEMGGVTPQEIRALIEGKLTLPEGSLLHTMGMFLQIEMSTLTPAQREILLSSGLEKLVEEDSSESLIPSIQSLFSLGTPTVAQEVNLSTKG